MSKNKINTKILIIGNGGIAKRENGTFLSNPDTKDFFLSLKKNGLNITYISHKGNIRTNKSLYSFDLRKNGIKFMVFFGGKRNPWRYINLIKVFFHIIKSNIVYIYYPGGLSRIGSLFCLLLRKKYGVYVRGHGQYINNNSKYTNVRNNGFNDLIVLKKANFLITVSPKLKEELLIYNEKTSIIKPMLDWDIKDIVKNSSNRFKSDSFNLLFVGSITERKGIFELIKMADFLDNKNFRYTINVFGDGPLLKKFKEDQMIGNISKNINFAGGVYNLDDKAKIYKNAHGYLMLSRNEGFPRVLYEAMIKGVPIFTTIVSGIAKTMIPDYNCVEMPLKDPEGQAKIILSFIRNIDLMTKISQNGSRTVRDILTKRLSHYEVLIRQIKRELQ